MANHEHPTLSSSATGLFDGDRWSRRTIRVLELPFPRSIAAHGSARGLPYNPSQRMVCPRAMRELPYDAREQVTPAHSNLLRDLS